MRAWTPILIVMAALVVAFAVPHGHAEDATPFSLESRIPASSMGMLSIEAVNEWGDRFEKTAIAGLVNDPDMKGFIDPIREDINRLLEGEGGRGPLDEVPPIVMEMLEQLQGLKGQLAFAVIGMEEGAEMPTMVASLDFGPNVDDFTAFLRRLKAEMGEDGENIQTFEREGRTWWQVDTGGPVISATTVDTAFVIATDPAALRSVLSPAGEGSLATSKDFQSVRSQCGGDDLGIFAYANAEPILGLFENQMDRRTRRMANALGLDTVKAVAYGMAFKGDGFMDTLLVHTPDANHGLSTLGLMPPMRPKALPYVPADAFWYSESATPLHDILPRARAIIAEADGEFESRLGEAITEAGQAVGVDIQNELMAGMGDGMAFYATLPEGGGVYPEVAIMCRLKDGASYEGTFDRFAKGLAGAITEDGGMIASTRDIEYRGHTLHLFELQAARGRRPIPFTPTWCVRDNWLIFTLVPYSMKELLLRGSGDATSPGLRGEEDFQALLAQMPADAGGIEYIDLQALMTLLYGTGAPLAQTLAKPNVMQMPVRMDWAQLPPATTVRKYFRSMASFTRWTRDGIRVQMHAPIPVVGLLAVAGVGMATLMVGGRSSAVSSGMIEMHPRAVDQDIARIQAEEILRYVRLYRLEKGTLPANLEQLVKSGIMRTIPRDPWGNPYYLVGRMKMVDGKPEPDGAVVMSAGRDGERNTDDDLSTSIK